MTTPGADTARAAVERLVVCLHGRWPDRVMVAETEAANVLLALLAEREALETAIVNEAIACGITDGSMSLTGPQVLLLAENIRAEREARETALRAAVLELFEDWWAGHRLLGVDENISPQAFRDALAALATGAAPK